MTLSSQKGTGISLHIPDFPRALKGHDFSRAVSASQYPRALAPEGCFNPLSGLGFSRNLFSRVCQRLPSAAKAAVDVVAFFGTVKTVPFQNAVFSAGFHTRAKKLALRHIITVLLILFSASFLPAQITPSAHDLAERADRHYNELRSLRAQFTEDYEGLGRARSESGNLLLEKPGRMRWDYTNPSGKVFLLDGKYAWFYSKGAPQVQRISAKDVDDLRSPLRFLLGHTQLEKEIDHLAAASAGNGAFTLSGVPHGQDKRVQKLTLTVTAAGVITAIEVKEIDGAVTRFTFAREQKNIAIPGEAFRFTPPAGVPVVNALPPV
jgi:outer membrane lipoprotein carrier protein